MWFNLRVESKINKIKQTHAGNRLMVSKEKGIGKGELGEKDKGIKKYNL